jgi:hypothetical protein
MLLRSLHTKRAARFFVLIYLLLITVTGNAFFWCTDAESSPHLESSLSGKCWMPCPSEPEERQRNEPTSNPSVAFSSDLGDCVDSPVYSSVITPSNQHRPKSKITETGIKTANSSFLLAKSLGAVCLGNPSLARQLPPRQALAVLRTVVLLH